MIHTYLILDAETGRIVFQIKADEATALANLQSGQTILTDHPEFINIAANTHYWNQATETFIAIPASPDTWSKFDYVSKQWVDLRTLQEMQEQKWLEIKSQRNALEFGGFKFEGFIYDSDQVSQGRILGAASAGLTQVWTLADNTTITLSADQLMQLYHALQIHIAAAHERGRIAREAILTATTKEAVEAVVF